MSGLTGFEVSGNDLSYIFKPYDGDTPKVPTTNFITTDISGDLCNIFQPYDGSSLKTNLTGFVTSASGDLCNIFQPILYTISSQTDNITYSERSTTDYTGLVFDFSGNKPNTTTNIPLASAIITFNMDISVNLIIIGGGGSGAGDGGGGGGGGGTIDMSFNIVKGTTYNITVACGTSSAGLNIPIYGGNSVFNSSYVAYSGSGGYPRGYSNPLGGNGGGTNMTSSNENGGGGGGGACGFLNNTPTVSSGGNNNSDNSNYGQNGTFVGGSSYNYTTIPIKSISVPFMNSSSIITCGGGGGACFNNTDKGGTAGNGYGGFTFETGGIGYPGNNDIHTGYGGGGGGGGSFGNNYSGGAGGNGVVIIYWSNNQ
jgi:hypothetical protein